MKLNGVNSDNYLYLRLINDAKLPSSHVTLKAGTIVRLNIAVLRDTIWKPEVRDKLFTKEFNLETNEYSDNLFYLEIEPKKEISTGSFLPQALYQSFTIRRDLELFIKIHPKDLIVINANLMNRLNREKFSWDAYTRDDARSINEFNQTFFDNGILTPSNNNVDALVPLNPQGIFEYLGKTKSRGDSERNFEGGNVICGSDSDVICVPFESGEILNLNDPSLALLFLNQEYLRFLLNTEEVPEEEKLDLFKRDFECWVPEAGRRYFKLHDYIKIKSLNDFTKHEVFEMIRKQNPDFENLFYDNHWRYSHADDFDFDSEGYLRYVHTGDEPVVEIELSKIADRVSAEAGRKHYEHEQSEIKRQAQEKELKKRAEQYFKAHKSRFYKLVRINPNLSHIEFMQMEEERETKLKRTLVRRLNNTLTKRINDLNH